MKNIELVNNVKHRNTRIITRKGKEFGDGVMSVATFPLEFRLLQPHYPILFQKDPETDRFNALALFGFEERENLFLDDKGWNASYIPLVMQRQPFHIGFQRGSTGSNDDKSRVMSINMDSPRINEQEGERLFLEQGGTTEFLDYMAAMLETIHRWNEQGQQFDQILLQYNLLEPVTFDITLTNGRQAQLLGFYTINEDVLGKLDGETLGKLNAMEYLMPIYMAIASLSNIKKLIALKSQKEAS